MHDLIIIGGGPAALAAAVFGLGKSLDLRMVYDKLGGWTGAHQHLPGQSAEEHVAGEEVVLQLEHGVLRSGMSLCDRVTRVWGSNAGFQVETEHHGVLEATAVLVATGAAPVQLDVPGARQFVGYGLAYSATTHIQVLAGKRVAVIGSTDRALRGVVELTRVGSHVSLIADTLDYESPLAQLVPSMTGVEVLEGWCVESVAGGAGVEQLVLKRGAETRRLRVDAAFVALGLVANSTIVQGVAQTDRNGFIKVDERRATSMPGLFAAGDVTTAVGEQKLIAIGEGARAAWSAYGYVLA